jgi:phage terminase small subunit
MAMTRKKRMFVQAYCADKDGNVMRSAIAAGYSEAWSRGNSHKLMKDPEIRAEIERQQTARANAMNISAEKVLQDLAAIADADITEFVTVRRGCCRYCYGENHDYQFKHSEWIELIRRPRDGKRKAAAPDPRGGVGYNPRLDPNDDCPECFGEGVAMIDVDDLARLPTEKRKLISVVKCGANGGIEVKLRDADKAKELIARHLGMLQDNKLDVNVNIGLADRISRARRRVVQSDK